MSGADENGAYDTVRNLRPLPRAGHALKDRNPQGQAMPQGNDSDATKDEEEP